MPQYSFYPKGKGQEQSPEAGWYRLCTKQRKGTEENMEEALTSNNAVWPQILGVALLSMGEYRKIWGGCQEECGMARALSQRKPLAGLTRGF